MSLYFIYLHIVCLNVNVIVEINRYFETNQRGKKSSIKSA
jgi:hypothetical protein